MKKIKKTTKGRNNVCNENRNEKKMKRKNGKQLEILSVITGYCHKSIIIIVVYVVVII